MNPQVAPSGLRGVRYGEVERHSDVRGSFRELWRTEVFTGFDPADAGAPRGATLQAVQANLSASAAGVLRGLHLHRRQMDHWVVASGSAFVALVDVRPLLERSGSRAHVETRVLVADQTVTIPVGVAHGFLALEPLELVYFVTNSYDGSDELGFAWDDPGVAVPWPAVATSDGRPVISGRDGLNPSLAELIETLRV